jgi:hypothetical protein
VKMIVRVSQRVELEFSDPRVTKQIAQQMATAFEAGQRFGIEKDLAMMNEVYRQQFGHSARIRIPDALFDFTFEGLGE